MTSFTRHFSRSAAPPDSRRRSIVAPALAVLVTAGTVLVTPTIAGANDAPTASLSGEFLDKAANPDADEIEALLQDPAFDLDGDMVRVSDLAPVGPFLADLDDVEHGDDGDGPQSAASQSSALSLHSRPDSELKIFLDFDGHITTGTPWNGSDAAPIVSPPYTRDSTVSTDFSQTDIGAIVEIWSNVAEDFAPWDVDVTTEDPGVAGLSNSSSNDTAYGIRVVITSDSSWYGPYGGAAYLYSFTRSYDLPAFVFSNNLANGREKSVAEAASHEAGHALGLSHDATVNPDGSTTGYYAGHGDWAPIMGVGYHRPVTQWSRGEYSSASNTEDDIAILDQFLDRATGNAGSTGISTTSTLTNVISTGGSTERHELMFTQGPVSISVNKKVAEGNLLADLKVRDSSGAVVASDTPDAPDSWSLGVTLPVGTSPGSYTIEVRSIGWGNASTGFTSYASVGEYQLSVLAPNATTSTTTTPTTEPGDDTPETPNTDPTPTVVPTPPTESDAGDRFTAVSPERLLDTRRTDSRLAAGQRLTLDPLALPGVDDAATAVVMNIVAVNASEAGFLSVTPCASIDPSTSTLNFTANTNVGNSTIAPLSTAGLVCIDTSAAVDLVVDVTGWLGPNGEGALSSLDAIRVTDSRQPGGISRRLSPNVRYVVPLGNVLSPSTNAVSINVTAVNPDDDGFVTVDDCTASTPATSSLNFSAGQTRSNNGMFTVGSSQALCVLSSTATDLTIDVTGQFGPGDGLTFVAANPVRLLDTRTTGDRLAAQASTDFAVPSPTAKDGTQQQPGAVSINLAAARHTSGGHVTSWGCGELPDTSALNPVVGAPTANSALVEVAPDGQSCLFHESGGDLIVDLTGWWI